MNDETLPESRADLLRLMKRFGEINVKKGAEELDLSASTIRLHLAGLEADGFIQPRLKREGIGRPTKMYSLTEKADRFFKSQERTFLRKLLREQISDGHTEWLEEFIAANCRRMREEWQKSLAYASPNQRLEVLQQLLEEWGYFPEVRFDEDQKLVIEFFHCPYPNVASLVAKQCQCEQKLLEELTGTSLDRECHMVKGACSCRFRSEEAMPRE